MKKLLLSAGLILSLGLVDSGAAMADTIGKSAGDILVRVRATAVVPDEDSTISAIGGEADIDEEYIPEIDFSYFFTDNIAAELVLTSTKHDVTASGTSLGDVDLGDVRLLPPTLTAQYHFLPKETFSPYLGAGISYVWFFDESAPGGTVNSIHYDDSFGYVLQAGLDVQLEGPWSINFDAKKVFLDTEVDINNGAITADVDVDHWIFSVGVGYRF